MSEDVRTATVRALWDDVASIYQDVIVPALREPHLAIRALAGDVGGLDVLDLGCGTGAMSELLGPGGARVTAVDLAPHMVAVARERLAGVPGVMGVEVMDAQALDLPTPPSTSWWPRSALCSAPITPRRLAKCTECCDPAAGW